jgi:hypothetical protein
MLRIARFPMRKIRARSLVLSLLLTSVLACAPRATTGPLVFWGGEEGAACMARILATSIPERDTQVRMFQDFDVVYAILEFTFRSRRAHLIVVSAADWEKKRVVHAGMDYPPPQPLTRPHKYYYQRGEPAPSLPALAESGAITPAVIAEWDRSCNAGERWLLGGNPNPRAPRPAPIFKVDDGFLAVWSAAWEAGRAGNYVEGIAKAREADAFPGKPPHLGEELHKMIVRYAISAMDYATALTELDKMIAAGEGDMEENLKRREELTSKTQTH